MQSVPFDALRGGTQAFVCGLWTGPPTGLVGAQFRAQPGPGLGTTELSFGTQLGGLLGHFLDLFWSLFEPIFGPIPAANWGSFRPCLGSLLT